MEYTFGYDVVVEKTNVTIASVTFAEELSEGEAKRVKESWNTGKYYNLDEDENLRDIYDRIYDIACQSEAQEEYAELIGTEIVIVNFRYPEELR